MSDELRAALAELVACKDLKIQCDATPSDWLTYRLNYDEYLRRAPLAWERARAALAATPAAVEPYGYVSERGDFQKRMGDKAGAYWVPVYAIYTISGGDFDPTTLDEAKRIYATVAEPLLDRIAILESEMIAALALAMSLEQDAKRLNWLIDNCPYFVRNNGHQLPENSRSAIDLAITQDAP